MFKIAAAFVFVFAAIFSCENLFANKDTNEPVLMHYTVESNGKIAQILKQGNTYTFADEFGKVAKKIVVDDKGNFVVWGTPGHMFDDGRIIYWHGNRWLRKSSRKFARGETIEVEPHPAHLELIGIHARKQDCHVNAADADANKAILTNSIASPANMAGLFLFR